MSEKIITPQQPTRTVLERLTKEALQDVAKDGHSRTATEFIDSASLQVIARIGLRMLKEQQDRNKLLERIAVALEKGIWS